MQSDYWYGVIIGFDNSMTAKGVMRYIGTEDYTILFKRMDGRMYSINMDKTSLIMSDELADYVEGDTEETLMKMKSVQDWLKDNCYRKDRDNGAL